MNDRRLCYLSILLRLWCVTTDKSAVWRAPLEDAHTGERRGFADSTSLSALVEAQIANRTRSANKDDMRGG